MVSLKETQGGYVATTMHVVISDTWSAIQSRLDLIIVRSAAAKVITGISHLQKLQLVHSREDSGQTRAHRKGSVIGCEI